MKKHLSALALGLGLSGVALGLKWVDSHWLHDKVANGKSQLEQVATSFKAQIEDAFKPASPKLNPQNTAKPLPAIVTATGPTTVCDGDSVRLEAPAGFDHYRWSNGDTTQIIYAKQSGHYTVRVGFLGGPLSDTLGGLQESGVVVYPAGATGSDSVWVFVNKSQTCPTVGNQSLSNANEIRIHSGVNGFQNVVPANDGNPVSQTLLTPYGNWFYKKIVPSTYYGVAGNTINAIDFVLTGGAQNGGWFPHEGKRDNAGNCVDFNVALPVANTSGKSPFGVTVNVTPRPATPTATATGSTTLCAGEAVWLKASGGATGSYVWSNGATSDSIRVSQSGVYSVRTGSGSCISSFSNAINVVVQPRPLPAMVTASGSTAICLGDSVMLSAPAGFAEYLWNTGQTTQQIYAKQAGRYWVRVGYGNGCLSDTLSGFMSSGMIVYPSGATANDSIHLFLNPNMTCPLAPSPNSLAGANIVRLHSGVTLGGNQWQNVVSTTDGAVEPFTRFNAMSQWWTKSILPRTYYNATGATAINGVLNGGAPANGWFEREGKVEPGCGDFNIPFPVPSTPMANPFAVTVSINAQSPAPTVTASGPVAFCQGGSVILRASGAQTGSYRWSDGSTADSLTVTASGSYTVFSVVGACTSLTSAATVVTVTPGGIQTPTVTPAGPTTFCGGDSVVLTSSPAGPGQKYLWSNGDTTQSITVRRSGDYTVVVQDGPCSSTSSAPITVTVTAKPMPVMVTASGATEFCAGDSVTLSAPAGYAQYLWSDGSTSQSIVVRTAGRYTVRVANGNGCFSDTLSGMNRSGVWVHPANATADDSIYLFVNPAQTCPLPAGNPGQSLNGANIVRMHSGATINGQAWSNLVSTTDPALEPSTRFTGMGNWWVKAIRPRRYYNVAAGAGVQGLNFVLNGGAPVGGWFEREGKDETANCGDFFFALPVMNVATESPFGVTVKVNPQPATPAATADGPTTFCFGQSVVLRASGGTAGAYQWSDGSMADTLLVTASGNYSVQNKVGTCLSPASNIVAVTVTESPGINITAAGNTSFCLGDSVVLTADAINTGQSYRWSNGDTTRSITVRTTGNYSVRVFENGCGSAASNVVAVTAAAKPLPAIVTAAGPTSFCLGDSVTLNAPAGFNFYLWSNGETTRSIAAKTAGHYTVRVANVMGCYSDTLNGSSVSGVYVHPAGATADDSVYLFLNPAMTCPLPTANAIVSLVGTNLIRLHSGATIGSNPWQNVMSTTDANVEPLTRFNQYGNWFVKAIKPSAYYQTTGITGMNFVLNGGAPAGGWFQKEGKVEPGCGDFGITFPVANTPMASPFGVTVSINATPAPAVITASGSTNFCVGGSVVLRPSGGVSGSYVWSNGATSDTLVVTTSGSYTVRSFTGVCTSAVSNAIVVNVTANPAPVIIAMGDTTFCVGGSVVLGTDSVPGARYEWTNGDTTRMITASRTGRYAVRVFTNGCGSDWSDSVTVTAVAKPLPVAVSAVGRTSVCEGDSVRLIAPGGYSQYLWSNGATTQEIFAKQSGHYTVRVANSLGCLSDTLAGFNVSGITVYPAGATADDSLYIIVNPTQTCPLAPSANSLAGANIVRMHSGANINGSRWSNVVSTTVAGTEPLTRFTSFGTGWAKALKPRAYYNAGATDNVTELCFVLNGGAPVGGWFEREGKVQPGCADFFVPLPVPTTPMASPFGVTVVVTPLPAKPSISPVDSASVCSNGTVTLTAPTGTGFRYRWSNNDTTQAITVRAGGSYTVQVLNGSCSSAVSDPVIVRVKPAPVATAILRNDSLFVSPTATSYQWLLGGLPILGANGSFLVPTTSGNYSAIITVNGCTDTSNVVVVISLASVKSGNMQFSMYPNPANGLVQLAASADVWAQAKAVRIYSVLGKEVVSHPIAPTTDGVMQINLDGLPAGTYQVVLSGTGISKKLVVR